MLLTKTGRERVEKGGKRARFLTPSEPVRKG